MDNYGDLVDYWITFNEPHVFSMLTYCAGAWPGGDPDMLETVTAAMPKGVFKVVMQAMADAHLDAYDIIHKSRYFFYFFVFRVYDYHHGLSNACHLLVFLVYMRYVVLVLI